MARNYTNNKSIQEEYSISYSVASNPISQSTNGSILYPKDLGYITDESYAGKNPTSDTEAVWNIRAVGKTADERIANYAKFGKILKEIDQIGYWEGGNSPINFGSSNRILQAMISAIDELGANYDRTNELDSKWRSQYALAGIYGANLTKMNPSELKNLGKW